MNIRASDLPDNPYETSSALSKVFCFWLTPFIRKGFKKELVLEDFYRLPEEDLSKDLGHKLKREWNKELQYVRQGKKASFVRALCRAFGFWYLLSSIWITIGEIIVRPFQAISLGWLIRDVNLYLGLDENANPDLINEYYFKVFYDGLLVILFSIISLVTVHPYVFCTQHIGMKVRVACCHLIYRHSLKLSNAAIGQTTVGQMVNLLSNDVNRFDLALSYIQYLVVAPVQAIITLTILSVLFLGFYSTAAGALILLFYVPFQTLMGRWFGKLRQLTAKRTDERIRLMNEIIPAMRVIKMYTWEDSFAALVELARENEIRLIRYTSVLRGINMALFFVASKIILFICFITYILLGYTLDAEIVFVSITLFNSVRLLMTLFFPYGVAQLAETLISCSRLEEFLLLPKQEANHRIDRGNRDSKVKPEEVEVNCMDVSANWTIINKTFTTEQLVGAGNDKEASSLKQRLQAAASVKDAADKANKESPKSKNSIFSSSTNVHLSSTASKKEADSKNLSASLESSGSTEQTAISALRNVTYQVRSGELMIILGRVGSGKSSVLMSMLGELPLASGQMKIRGRISYASQEPWIFAGTVRENVLFGKEMEESRYKKVLRVCSLDRDLELLPEGDATIVGERGVSLSGGQRARINLARAVYYEADIYLLDDPLSAVDAIVAKHIFNECIGGFLKDKAVILATHQTQFVSQETKVLFLQDGRQISCKSYSDNKDLQLFMGSTWEKSDSESALSGAKHPRRAGVSKGESALRAAGIGKVASLGGPGEIREMSVEVSEEKREQPLKEHPSGSSSSCSDNDNSNKSRIGSSGNDELDQEDDELVEGVISGDVTGQRAGATDKVAAGEKRRQQQSESTGGSLQNGASVYWYYIKASKAALLVLTLAMANLATQALFNGSDFWLSYWTDTEQRKAANGGSSDYPPVSITDTLTLKENAIVYTVLILSLFVITLVRTTCFFVLCMRSSVNLHKQLFRSVLKAPIKFFDYNPIGVLLNRVSRDMGIVDDQLPPTAFDTIEIAVNVLGTLITVAAIYPANIIPAVLLCTAVGIIRLLYIRTVRSIKSLEGVTRSPVFSHLAASLDGLATIRAFRVEGEFEEKFDQYQDVHTSAWFLFVAASRWLGCSLDWLSLIYIAIITLLMTLTVGGSTTGAQIGLAISSALFLSGSFQWGVRQSTETESQMCSVSRIREYSELPEEPPRLSVDPDKKPPSSWPELGQIEFREVSLRYFENEDPVLRRISFVIRPGEQVGIVGRTGAGKSSIIEVLFRLTEPECGEILIDGRRTQDMGLHELRKKLSIIPQEPILFNGPIRRNLDPFSEYQDTDLWRALEQVKLADLVRQLPGALDAELNEGGSNFSVGERQLICLARAVLRQNRIIILDEATANVDPDTDKFIQRTISESFTKCTRVTIAHRLKTIMDSDRVLVMEAGQVKEFGEPHLLLQEENGIFSRMVKNTGKSAHLRKIARNCYERRMKKKQAQQASTSALEEPTVSKTTSSK